MAGNMWRVSVAGKNWECDAKLQTFPILHLSPATLVPAWGSRSDRNPVPGAPSSGLGPSKRRLRKSLEKLVFQCFFNLLFDGVTACQPRLAGGFMRSQESTRSRRFLLIILLTTSFLMEMKVDLKSTYTSFHTATRNTPCEWKCGGG